MKTRLQRIWGNMKDRCTNPNNPSYHRYGGRGISYWCSWDNFEVFRYWALTNGYEEHLTLERVNNDGDYTPFNCRWATRKEQSRNTSNNRWLHYMGEDLLITEVAERIGITYQTLQYRLATYPNNPEKWYAPKNQGRRGIPRKKVCDGKRK